MNIQSMRGNAICIKHLQATRGCRYTGTCRDKRRKRAGYNKLGACCCARLNMHSSARSQSAALASSRPQSSNSRLSKASSRGKSFLQTTPRKFNKPRSSFHISILLCISSPCCRLAITDFSPLTLRSRRPPQKAAEVPQLHVGPHWTGDELDVYLQILSG